MISCFIFFLVSLFMVIISDSLKFTIFGYIVLIVGGVISITGAIKYRSYLENDKTEYEIVKVVHYQAVDAEEVNQVLLEDVDGKFFYIYVNDKKFLEMRKQKENGNMVVSLSGNDLAKIANTK